MLYDWVEDNNYYTSFIYFVLFIYCFCAVSYVIFLKKKHHTTLKTVLSIHISWRLRRYGCLATAKNPFLSQRCKLIGLCWLLWRYCLWWLPLAILFLAVAFIHHAQLHGELLWRPWIVFGALWVSSIILSCFANTDQLYCHCTWDFVSNWLSWHAIIFFCNISILLRRAILSINPKSNMDINISFDGFCFWLVSFLLFVMIIILTYPPCLVGWCFSFRECRVFVRL